MSYCIKCGEKIEEGTKFCVHCGAQVRAPEMKKTAVGIKGVIGLIGGLLVVASMLLPWMIVSITGAGTQSVSGLDLAEDLPAVLFAPVLALTGAILAIVGGISALAKVKVKVVVVLLGFGWILSLLGGIFGVAKALTVGAVSEAWAAGNVSIGYGIYVEIVGAILVLTGYGLCRAQARMGRLSF